ncbi:Protein of unknown function [Proteiniborus ethanoligenes]|uniref:Niacin transporter n=1 Tax=Proteiniborus ethanoligenes TaxID=415015 RepID=A0A1H3MY58_9FIRM|nr:ECF transporter S component [Proteiniborus ethanoligenes]TAH64005.1 MAG: ECF transporter S component [Gottschalkiaceae bacterium]SDY81602.1 Protein of unknown function [Proteiniborus ethanoligenes]
MNRKFLTRDLILGGVLLALGIVIPMIFHTVGIMGTVFLPMHIPVLIGGLLISPALALLLGMITPILNSSLTGMPLMFPIATIMMFELGAYGLISSLSTRKLKLSPILALIISMIIGRIVAGITVFVLSSYFGVQMNALTYVKGSIITGLPGIGIQLILIPSLVYALKKANKV